MIGNRREVVRKSIGSNGGHLRHSHCVAGVGIWHRRARDVIHVRVLLGAIWLPVLLQMLLGVLQMIGTGGVTPTYRAFLEMALQDIASAEGVFAEMALIRSFARVYET